MFCGGFPNEILVAENYKNHTLSEFPTSFFFYFVLMVIIAAISIVIQLKRRETNEEAYNYRKYDFKYRRQQNL